MSNDLFTALTGHTSVSRELFEDELRYLREEGARFAARYPRLAARLNLESSKDRDPAVELLFEGFAFLCAGIRRRLDDGFPELSEGLVDMLWPQYLEAIPGTCVVEFKPRGGMLQGSYMIRKGTEIFTPPDRESGVSCCFTTAWEVTVNPLSLDGAECTRGASGKEELTLRFKLDEGMRPDDLRLAPLRVYIHDDLPSALSIRKLLLYHVEAAEVADDQGQTVRLNPRGVFAEGGFGEGEDLFCDCQNVNRPFSLMRDYFTLPERFMFVDIHGLDSLPRSPKPPEVLTLRVRFDKRMPGGAMPSASNIRLYCAPAVNIFKRDAEPVIVSGEAREYRLTGDAVHPDNYTIHSVESVVGIDGVTGERREYGRQGGASLTRFYSLRRDRAPDGGLEFALSMNGRQTENGRLIRETLHIETRQSNGAYAREAVGAGGLRKPARDFPDFITFTNITLPNNPINPPAGEAHMRTFLSHMACAHTDFCDMERLKELLYCYDWIGAWADVDIKKAHPEIDAIVSVTSKPIDLAVDRAVIRGNEMTVIVDGCNTTEEAMLLFGSILARALSCMGSINTFLKLVLVISESDKRYEWYCQGGERWVI